MSKLMDSSLSEVKREVEEVNSVECCDSYGLSPRSNRKRVSSEAGSEDGKRSEFGL